MKNMLFHAYHGVWDEEREVGQRFQVDVEIYDDFSVAGKSDRLKDTIDLYRVYQVVEEVVVRRQFKLVEALAETIAQALLQQFNIREIRVRVRKPNSPIKGISDGIEVEIVRKAQAG
ncbi:MAG: dihydroneopterin aldolase [candidate division KSB1 bacterium]|nr:dihydroneopterin aldolase [candidate division KSB1 bacterium]